MRLALQPHTIGLVNIKYKYKRLYLQVQHQLQQLQQQQQQQLQLQQLQQLQKLLINMNMME